MQPITLSKIDYKGQQRLALEFAYNHTLIETAKTIKGYEYSRTLKKWHYPYTIKHIELVKKAFESIAKIECNFTKNETKTQQEDEAIIAHINKFTSWLKSKRYSASTIKTYCEAAKTFLVFYKNKTLTEITNDDIIQFNNDYILAKKLSAAF